MHDDVPTEDNREILNWFISAPPRHPLIRAALEHVLKNLRNPPSGLPRTGKEAVWRLTGPIAFTRGIVGAPEWKDQSVRRKVAERVSFAGLVYSAFPRIVSVVNRGPLGQLLTYRDFKTTNVLVGTDE